MCICCIWISNYPIKLQYGALKIVLQSIYTYGIMDYWGFINVTERNYWMTLNTAFIHT